ncbi:MAG: hypothetical protein J2P19_14750, partial [Pseudonocardia sp.]|nr:hypothetical protein [Pseudonocardia sp.]
LPVPPAARPSSEPPASTEPGEGDAERELPTSDRELPTPDREPITVGAPDADPPRPARRRRRVASRPAGPPADGDADTGRADAAAEPAGPDPV